MNKYQHIQFQAEEIVKKKLNHILKESLGVYGDAVEVKKCSIELSFSKSFIDLTNAIELAEGMTT